MKNHLYIVSGNEDLAFQLKPLAKDYKVSCDIDGQLLKNINLKRKKRDIDLVVTDFDFFKNHINDVFNPELPEYAPSFLVAVNKHNAHQLAEAKRNLKCFPIFTPINIEQVQLLITALLQKPNKIIDLEEVEHFRKLFQEAANPQMLVNSSDYKIIDANQAAFELYGRKRKRAILGLGLPDLHPSHAELLTENLAQAKKSCQSQLSLPLECVKRGTRDLYFAFSKINIGKKSLLFVNIQDVSEAKDAERILTLKNDELQKTNSELDNFVYSTSHELRAPLMSVLGLINLLESENNKKEVTLYLGLMKESIHKLDSIIHDIIDYSRNARFDVNILPIDFNHIISKITNNLRFIKGAEKTDIRININEEVPFYSDRRRIEIIVNNLISNSLKFSNPKASEPFVEVYIHVTEDNALIRVEDNGLGITENHLPRIFEMFFRGNENSSGSGIGLYILKEIVEKLNGYIFVDSVEGKGSIFTIKIPNQFKT